VEVRKEEENYTIRSFIPRPNLHIFWRQSSWQGEDWRDRIPEERYTLDYFGL